MVKWFIQHQGQIQGPFTDESLESTLDTMGSTQTENALVWKRGLGEWIKSTKWKTELAQTFSVPAGELTTVNTNVKPTVPPTATQAPTFSETFTESAFYRVQINFVDQPLMSKVELLAFISKQKDISTLSIQNPKTKEWTDVYAYPDIVERLGLSRRKHARVPILANFNGTSQNGAPVSVKVVTVSEGGMGFTDVFDLKIGDAVEGQISSPHFFQPLHVKADVIYSGLDGYIGLKFSQINDEAKSAIIEYVKKFGKHSS